MDSIFPVIELFDRLAIAQVKWQRTKNNKEELDWYTAQTTAYNFNLVADLFDDLVSIHNRIWDLEADIRLGHDQQLGLEEIGRRAILIRDHNHKRITIKNQIAKRLNCNVREIKKDHLSE